MTLQAQPGLGQMLLLCPSTTTCPTPVSLLPVSFVPPRRLRATYSSVGCALPQVTGSGSELDWYPVLVTCAKPCTLPRRRGHLCLIHPNATYGPALALRPGVWAPAPSTIRTIWILKKYTFMNYWMDWLMSWNGQWGRKEEASKIS